VELQLAGEQKEAVVVVGVGEGQVGAFEAVDVSVDSVVGQVVVPQLPRISHGAVVQDVGEGGPHRGAVGVAPDHSSSFRRRPRAAQAVWKLGYTTPSTVRRSSKLVEPHWVVRRGRRKKRSPWEGLLWNMRPIASVLFTRGFHFLPFLS
jgi:hypothetical protein